jgi:hypothetical protein
VVINNTPANFKIALQMIKDHIRADTTVFLPIVTINCWNEWTEGSYLEPDSVHGLQYMEAVKDVFGTK